jgi:hypothetical protein
MALGLTQPLTEISTRNLPGGKGRLARKADNLTAICEPQRLTLWAFTVYYGIALPLMFSDTQSSLPSVLKHLNMTE